MQINILRVVFGITGDRFYKIGIKTNLCHQSSPSARNQVFDCKQYIYIYIVPNKDVSNKKILFRKESIQNALSRKQGFIFD